MWIKSIWLNSSGEVGRFLIYHICIYLQYVVIPNIITIIHTQSIYIWNAVRFPFTERDIAIPSPLCSQFERIFLARIVLPWQQQYGAVQAATTLFASRRDTTVGYHALIFIVSVVCLGTAVTVAAIGAAVKAITMECVCSSIRRHRGHSVAIRRYCRCADTTKWFGTRRQFHSVANCSQCDVARLWYGPAKQ